MIDRLKENDRIERILYYDCLTPTMVSDGDMESMPFIGAENSTTLAWLVTFDPALGIILETDIRTHGIDSVST